MAIGYRLSVELRERLGTPLTPAGEEWFVQMTAVELRHCEPDAAQSRLRDTYRIEVPVQLWNGRTLLRVSVQAYNTRADLECLADALPHVLQT